MKAATIHDISRELKELSPATLQVLCLRLAKYKKENKELLTYLLFEAQDEKAFKESVKNDMASEFDTIPNRNVYYLKKSIRKILRMVNKWVRYSGIATTEIELRIHFCQLIQEQKIPLRESIVLSNMYYQQIKKIKTIQEKLDEDIQYDYESVIQSL